MQVRGLWRDYFVIWEREGLGLLGRCFDLMFLRARVRYYLECDFSGQVVNIRGFGQQSLAFQEQN